MLSLTDHTESGNLPLLRFTPRALFHPILHINTKKITSQSAQRRIIYCWRFAWGEDWTWFIPMISGRLKDWHAPVAAPPPTSVKLSRFAHDAGARRHVPPAG